MTVALLFVAVGAIVQAGPTRRYWQSRMVLPATKLTALPVQVQKKSSVRPVESSAPPAKSIADAQVEVNTERAKQGLRRFLPGPLIKQAARMPPKVTNEMDQRTGFHPGCPDRFCERAGKVQIRGEMESLNLVCRFGIGLWYG